MDNDFLETEHEEFIYTFINSDINESLKELKFKGNEKSFQNTLNNHFNRIFLDEKGKKEVIKNIDNYINQTSNDKTNTKLENLNQNWINETINKISSYQIIPLILPTKETNFYGLNCYIDDVGIIKKLSLNSRATRICNTDIYGDAFLSKFYDDNDNFKRVNYTIKDCEELLINPPKNIKSFNKRTYLEAMLNEFKQNENKNTSNTNEEKKICENCHKETDLKRCGKCKKIYYCSIQCQKEDYTFHRRICL